MTIKYTDEDLNRVISSISPEDMKKRNEELVRRTKEDFARFEDLYHQGICDVCQKRLDVFERSVPCMHWLMRPAGFKNDDFRLIYKNFGYFRIDSFLRWVANIDGPLLRNINDLEEEKTPGKILEHTIVFKNLEWSFSCTESDFNGHSNSVFGKEPHYHFQMRCNGKPFIKYNNYHPSFSDTDVWYLLMLKKHPDIFVMKPMFGAGLQYARTELDPDIILNETTPSEDSQQELFNIQTVISAKSGETISVESIRKMYERSEIEDRTVASIAQEQFDNVQTHISISDKTPNIAARTPKKNKKNNKGKREEEPRM